MLFIKLTVGPFLQRQFFFKFAEFWVFRTYIGIFKLRVRVFVEQVKSVLLPEMG